MNTTPYSPGLGELLRHVTDLVDGGAERAYRRQAIRYRPRYTPIMRRLADGPATVSELTAAAIVSQGAVSQTLKLMQTDGLVQRSAGEDARRSVVSLTDKGWSLLDRLMIHWDSTFRAIDALEAEIDAPIRDILGRMVRALEQHGFDDRIRDQTDAHDSRSPS